MSRLVYLLEETIRIEDVTPYVGKIVAFGHVFHDRFGEEIEVKNYWGTIVGVNEQGWIQVLLQGENRAENGDILAIPPDLPASNRGTYRLPSTGEIVAADYSLSWDIYPPDVDQTVKGEFGITE